MNKKAKIFLNGFTGIVNKSKHKPDQLWVDQEKEFYNKLMQKWLDDNNSLMYFLRNEGNSVVVDRVVRALKKTLVKNLLMLLILL